MSISENRHRSKENLLYTIAFDPPGCTILRVQAKLFVMSALRTGFEGDLIVFSNAEARLFPCGRPGVKEVRIDTGAMKERELAEYACAFKYRAADYIARPERYGRILFTDCDCLALRNLAPLFSYDEDIVWAWEPDTSSEDPWHGGYFTEEEMADGPRPGINAGTWCVSGSRYADIVEAMFEVVRQGPTQRDVLWGDQPAWNKLVPVDRLPIGLSIHWIFDSPLFIIQSIRTTRRQP